MQVWMGVDDGRIFLSIEGVSVDLENMVDVRESM